MSQGFCQLCGTQLDPYSRCPYGHAQTAAAPPDAWQQQGYVTPQPYAPAPVYMPIQRPPMEAADKWAIAGFVVTLAGGLLGCCLTFMWIVSGPLGLIFGYMGMKSTRYRWMAIVSLVLGGLQLFAAVAWIFLVLVIGTSPAFLQGFQSGIGSSSSY